jgi:hypothetical protein
MNDGPSFPPDDIFGVRVQTDGMNIQKSIFEFIGMWKKIE